MRDRDQYFKLSSRHTQFSHQKCFSPHNTMKPGLNHAARTVQTQDLMRMNSRPWQDLMEDYSCCVKIPGSTRFLLKELYRSICDLAQTSSSKANFAESVENLWRRIGPWRLNNSVRIERFKDIARKFWRTYIKHGTWNQYEYDMQNSARGAKNQSSFTRAAWYL